MSRDNYRFAKYEIGETVVITSKMKLSVTKRQNPNTPYIDGFEADILLDDGTLAGRRAFTLVRIQDMLNDEAGLLENFEDCSDYAYAEKVMLHVMTWRYSRSIPEGHCSAPAVWRYVL